MEKLDKLTEEQKLLVSNNMNLVYKIANIFGYGYELEDLIQEGMLALTIAAKRYKEERGKFSTYAYSYVKGMMQTYLNRNKLIKPGRKGNQFIQHEVLSFDDEDLHLEVAGKDETDPLKVKIRNIIEQQKEPEKTILMLYYEGYTQTEIGKMVNKTQATISRTLLKIGDEYRKELENEIKGM